MRNRILTVLGVTFVVGLVLYLLGIKMTKDDLFISAAAEPLICIGGVREGEHCASGFPFTNSLLMTIVVDIVLAVLCFTVGMRLKLIPSGLQNVVEALIEFFYDFAKGVDARNVAKFFPLPATIFVFFLVANLGALIPGVGSIGVCVKNTPHTAQVASVSAAPLLAKSVEPVPSLLRGLPADCPALKNVEGEKTNIFIPLLRAPAADLNVTIAFALVAGIMIEVMGFQILGLGYLKKFFVNPFKEGAIQTLVGLLELLGEFTRILAFAFRIFGNIFGGEVILIVMSFLFPYLLPIPFYGLEIFVAFIQAVIFAVLTLVFFSLAVQAHGGHDDAHAEGAH